MFNTRKSVEMAEWLAEVVLEHVLVIVHDQTKGNLKKKVEKSDIYICIWYVILCPFFFYHWKEDVL